jgi:hypothetical protein
VAASLGRSPFSSLHRSAIGRHGDLGVLFRNRVEKDNRRRLDGRWNLHALHPDVEDAEYRSGMQTPFYSFALEFPGEPSRWITTTALAVLRRAGRI